MVFKKLMYATLLSGAVLFSQTAIADALQLKPQSFETQFDQTLSLDAQTQWVIFSTTKDGGNWVKETFAKLEFNEATLDSKHLLYVADIHKMPSFISKMFAIPKMRDYGFPIALDKEGEGTQDWPTQENAVNVYQLNQLEVVKTLHFANQADLENFLKGI
ncbi:hypothetical protein [Thiosulfativibrio zosterae]|uniref:FAD/FMN-containing dehydrogenase n=1 Tax=Thiosulfativibrio zosterae TaxID=2675053 RepID=A0A6F8PMM2_9GAMM|nr:hypothetical protein [Thiosulfativibrio zosterae]BBP43363.1 hypothetical protein THMIRHAT_11090 [Thiosulfativibrio zosterae]